MNRAVVVEAVASALVLFVAACSSSSTPASNGGDSGGGGMVLVCDDTAVATVDQCTKTTDLNSSLYSALQTQCTQNGGKVVSACPTAGVIGCCTNGPSEGCFYTGGTNPMTPAQCSTAGGTWSASP